MPSQQAWMRARPVEMRDGASRAAAQLPWGTGEGRCKARTLLLDFFTAALISEKTDLGLCQLKFCKGVTCPGPWQSEG